jgi:hypothetical protein
VEAESKTDRMIRVTAKITEMFENNHKKIVKYEALAKQPAGPSPPEPRFAIAVEKGFKKY